MDAQGELRVRLAGSPLDIARLRQELRERLMAQQPEGARGILDRLQALAALALSGGGELNAEVERWRLRFELLESAAQRA